MMRPPAVTSMGFQEIDTWVGETYRLDYPDPRARFPISSYIPAHKKVRSRLHRELAAIEGVAVVKTNHHGTIVFGRMAKADKNAIVAQITAIVESFVTEPTKWQPTPRKPRKKHPK